jgi:rhodanese-related sulfurtransferase
MSGFPHLREMYTMIATLQTGSPKVVGFKLSGKLHDDDYKTFVPTVEAAIAAQGKIRLLIQFEDFHGWDIHAAWDDFKFGVKHYKDFERIAMVGEQQWETWMARLCRPFTKAEVRYFETSQVEMARHWVAMTMKTINARDAHELLRTDPAAILVCAYDNEQEFRTHDLQGAISLSEFRRRIDRFPKDENVIFYCACPHDESALKQAEIYKAQGFCNVAVLEGGVEAWKSAGYSLVGTGA